MNRGNPATINVVLWNYKSFTISIGAAHSKGVGNDFYWPPNVASNYTVDKPAIERLVKQRLDFCAGLRSKGLQGLPREDLLDWKAAWPVLQYGGKSISKYASNIIFTNGRYDPWSQAGVLRDLSQTLISIYIEDGAHHTDLFFPSPGDTHSIRAARQQIKRTLLEWFGPSLTDDAIDHTWEQPNSKFNPNKSCNCGYLVIRIVEVFAILLPFAAILLLRPSFTTSVERTNHVQTHRYKSVFPNVPGGEVSAGQQ